MSRWDRQDWLGLALILAVVSSLFIINISYCGVTDPGEGYYVEAAREMVEGGDFVTPHLNYQIYFSKPILTFWLIAWSYRLFGISEFAARLPFAILIGLLCFFAYYVGRSFRGRRCGILAALIIATSPLMLALAKLSPIDIAFSCFIDMTVFSVSMAAFMALPHWWLLVWVALSLAVLTKGPAAIILMIIGLVMLVICERASPEIYRKRWRRLHPFAGFGIFSLITAPWYVAVAIATKGLFLKVFLFYENFARFSGLTNLAHTSWFQYVRVLSYGFFPWVLLLPFGIKGAFQSKNDSVDARGSLFLIASFSLGVFLFFSFSKTQLDTYILPMIAPAAILIAYYCDLCLSKSLAAQLSARRSGLFLFLAGSPFLFAVIAIGLFYSLLVRTNFYMNSVSYLILLPTLLLGAMLQFRLVFSMRLVSSLYLLFAVLIPTYALITDAAFESLDKSGQLQLRELCKPFYSADHSFYRLAIFRTFKPSLMFYLRQPIDSFFHPSQIVPGAENVHERQIVIAHEKTLPLLILPNRVSLEQVGRCGSWLAFRLHGGEVKSVQTLAEIFSNPEAFRRSVSGSAEWGPLTVPYGSGIRKPLSGTEQNGGMDRLNRID
jgi:4-amino-4-deoxy-L-arabinose transferase-like glycosyltransferase